MIADDQKVEIDGAAGVLVYRDYNDTDRFYYTSTRPAVARSGNDYRLTLVHYDKPAGNSAGMLSVLVNLEPDDSDIAKMRAQITAANSNAEFQPMPWSSGTVAAAIIGGDPVFATPSLLGNNSAALAFGLTTDQYLLLKQASSPISVVYSLGFEAFRPEYEYSIEFNETRFRNWIQKKCTANLVFISVEKVETFEELRENGVIRVVSVNQTGDTPPDGFRRAFLRSLQSILTPAPRFAEAPEAGGNSWPLSFGCSTVQDIQNIARRLDTNMQVSGAVARKAYIQGPLEGLAAAMAARPDIELSTNVKFTQSVAVRCQSAFGGQPLDAVNVSIAPPRISPSGHVFNDSMRQEWTVELTHAPGTISDFTYKCDFYFQKYKPCASGMVGIRREQAFVDIVPEEFYTYRLYSVSVADKFPWELMRSVRLTLSGPVDMVFSPREVVLTQAGSSGAIEGFAPTHVSLDDVSYTALYQPVDGGPIPIDGLPSGAVIYLSPFRKRMVTFRADPAFDWQSYTQISIAIDPTAGNPQLWGSGKGKLTLTKASPSAVFTYWFSNTAKLRYRTAFMLNGKLTPPKQLEAFGTNVIIPDREDTGLATATGRQE